MQRIVAGRLGGRRLLPLPRAITGVRPSSGRVRGAIFDRLQAEVVGARVLDLFAGTGALAIEALSRGAAAATLVEQHPRLVKFLGEQVGALGLEAQIEIVRGDARRFLTRVSEAPASARYDLVLVDPPYAEIELYAEVLDALVARAHLADDAIVVMEYEKRRGQRPAIPLPASLIHEVTRDHGQTALEFLRHRDLRLPSRE